MVNVFIFWTQDLGLVGNSNLYKLKNFRYLFLLTFASIYLVSILDLYYYPANPNLNFFPEIIQRVTPVFFLLILGVALWSICNNFYSIFFGGIAILIVIYIKHYSILPHCGWVEPLPIITGIWVCIERNKFSVDKNCHQVSNFWITILVLICSLIYFSNSMLRLSDQHWLNGEILEKVLYSRVFSRFTHLNFFNFKIFFYLASYYAFFAEFLGSFLFFSGSLKKYIILILIPVHVLLAIFTTEYTWQLLMLSMLYLIYNSKPVPQSTIQNSDYLKSNLLWLSLAIFLFLISLPVSTSNFIKRVRGVTKYVGLESIVGLQLMKEPPTKFLCLNAYGFKETTVTSIFKSDLISCIQGINGEVPTNLEHSAFINHRKIIPEGPVAEKITHRWGYSFCKQGRYSDVLITVYREVKGQTKYRVLAAYNCLQNKPIDTLNPKFNEIIMNDHKLINDFAIKNNLAI